MKILVAVFAFNEGEKIIQTLARHPKKRNYDLLVMDDGSTDGSLEGQNDKNTIILRNDINEGIGNAMKKVFQYAIDKKYEILVIQAGNNKDNPLEIPRLLKPIVNNQADFVQGSRYMKDGKIGNTPFYRILSTKYIHPILFSLAAGKMVTESTNGFRAFKTDVLSDSRIDWRQDWLGKYELEPYLLYKVIKLGYRHLEVPVTKIYPSHKIGYSKMPAITGWWSILKPIFYLSLGIKN